MEKTLQELEAGDLVYISSRYGYSIAKIKKITKTQIITTDGSKHRIRDGSLIGADPYNGQYLKILTEERKCKISILRLRTKAKKMINNIEIQNDISKLEKLIIAIKPFVSEDTK